MENDSVVEHTNQPITSTDHAEQSSTYADTLLQISPLPTAVIVPGARKRKATGSEVITSSPYKTSLVEKQGEKNRKPVKKTHSTASKRCYRKNAEHTNQPSTSTGHAVQSAPNADTLLQISPHPTAVIVRGARKRKATGSEVITSSPHKTSLVEKQGEKNRKPAKKTHSTASKSCCRKNATERKHQEPVASSVDNPSSPRVVTDETPDKEITENCNRAKRIRKQRFSLVEAIRAIQADSDGDTNTE
jgi:hypothetical protein